MTVLISGHSATRFEEELRDLPPGFWQSGTLDIARALLGKVVVSTLGGQLTAGRIVETEGYLHDDPACHSFRGRTQRNAAMFGPAGTAYVYFTYGCHFCLNFVTAPEGVGEAVLIRAMEPLAGLDIMRLRRGRQAPEELLSGPGKVCQAMGIGREMCGHPLDTPPLWVADDGCEAGDLVEAARVGLSVAAERRWRFYPQKAVRWVSRK